MSLSSERNSTARLDWGTGRYEHLAPELLPAAHAVVDAADPAAHERVVDVGCGTGNAALLAAARGALVTGVDPAGRLLDIARQRAEADGADVTFVAGDAAALPLPDGCADALLSVFGVIFATDSVAAAEEMGRVTAAGGRIVLSAWLPVGVIADAMRVAGEAVAKVAGPPVGPPPFSWHDQGALTQLLAPHGFAVTAEEHTIAFTASSAADFLEMQAVGNPVLNAIRETLERSGDAPAVFGQIVEILKAANEDPAAFRVTSRYVVATARRSGNTPT